MFNYLKSVRIKKKKKNSKLIKWMRKSCYKKYGNGRNFNLKMGKSLNFLMNSKYLTYLITIAMNLVEAVDLRWCISRKLESFLHPLLFKSQTLRYYTLFFFTLFFGCLFAIFLRQFNVLQTSLLSFKRWAHTEKN